MSENQTVVAQSHSPSVGNVSLNDNQTVLPHPTPANHPSIHLSQVHQVLPKQKPTTPWWKTPLSRKVFAVLGFLALAGTAWWWFEIHPYVSTDDARIAGTLVHFAPDGVSGRVIKVNVEEGNRVSKDEILVELDHRVPEAQLQRAQATERLCALEQHRLSRLVAQRAAPQRELDDAQAKLSAAEAELKLAQVNLDNTYLKSPLNGIVVQKTVEEGNILEPGQSALALLDLDGVWVSANVEETEAGLVKAGQDVFIKVDEGGHLKGKVLEVRHASVSAFALIPTENSSGNFTKLVQHIPVKIALDPHPGRDLRMGQSVEIRIRTR
jgi:multidrug resistance efflux pump